MTHDPDDMWTVTTSGGRTFGIPMALDASELRTLERMRQQRRSKDKPTELDRRAYDRLEARHLWHRTIMRLVTSQEYGPMQFGFWSSKTESLHDWMVIEGYDVGEF